MAYTKSGTFPENLKTTSETQNSMFVIFFWNFWDWPQMAKRLYRMCKKISPFYCKKLSQNRAPSEKLCPFYRRYLKLWFSESTTWQIGWRRLGQSFPILQHRTTAEQSFSAIEQPRAKRPWCMQQGYRQMKSRRAAMQGENTRRLATYLGLARREFTQGG